MATIIDYIQREQRAFSEQPFTPVDSLVLSSLCYCNFDHMKLRKDLVSSGSKNKVSTPATPSSNTPVPLFDILCLCDPGTLSQNSWLENSTETNDLYDAVRASRRYRGVDVVFFTNERSSIVDKQFSATTFLLGEAAFNPTGTRRRKADQVAYVAFRGTDGTFAGWKEDFDMAYKPVVPSQRDAAAYLSGVASALDCPLILGGHSKGGNLAQYAALCVNEKTYRRIWAVYDHDGPSFLTDPSPRRTSTGYRAKLHKTVPESSAFGMLLERHSDYRVVQSSAFALFQHSPFSWIIEDDDFSYQQELNASAQFFDSALDQWLRGKTSEERKLFVETAYDLLAQTKATNWGDFQAELASNLATVVVAGNKLDPETRKFLARTASGLIGTLKDQTIERIRATSPAKIASKWLAKRN